jgi:autotransporter translocation and assembly factor TamB
MMVGMRIVTLTALLLAVSAVAAAAGQQAAQIRLTGTSPIQVSGSGFAAGDRITVRVSQPTHPVLSKAVVATAGGRFVVRFPTHSLDECNAYSITATGASGTRATRRILIPPPCGIDPSP